MGSGPGFNHIDRQARGGTCKENIASRQQSPLKFDPADFKLVFLPGKLLLLSSPLLGEAPFDFDSALFTFKAHRIAEWRLKIFKKLPRKNAHTLDFDGLYANPKRRDFPWSGGVPCSAFFLLILSEVSFSDPSERKIFIKIGPVKAERGNLNIVQLVGGTLRQSRISRYGKAHFEATLHADYNVSVNEGCGSRGINQCAHATSQ